MDGAAVVAALARSPPLPGDLRLYVAGRGRPRPLLAVEPYTRPWDVGAFFDRAYPVVPGLCLWPVSRRGETPKTHLWATGAGITAVACDHLLQRAPVLLDPWGGQACPEHAGFDGVTPEYLAWTFAPAVLLPLGGRAGIRAASGRARPVPWRRVAVIVAAAGTAVAAAVLAVRLWPEPTGTQVLAADGTPRYALGLSDTRLAVLDLADPEAEPERVDAPDPEFRRSTAIARDSVPGRYPAAVVTAGDGALGQRRSRIHRIAMDGAGGAVVREQVGAEPSGIVTDLAVSPQGRIAYARVVGRPDDPFTVAATFVGLGGERREWAAPGGKRMLVSQVDAGRSWNQLLTLVETPSGVPVGTVFASGCADLAASGLDPSGRHLLVAVDAKAGQLVGDPPRPVCGDAPPYRLLRIDLAGVATARPSPALYPGEAPLLEPPRREVRHGDSGVHAIAW